ncbi:Uncharacterized protein ChrSV_3959 [Chromobacterium vaccinii]|nr:Uncharacterized protein ChrSW_3959 [Chromobacterium vaccinii]QND91416.1 Uncharacterized protein ChrSV_3959 [Chromobacterium vaccinii]
MLQEDDIATVFLPNPRKPIAQSLHCASPNWQYRLRAIQNTN